MSTGSQICTKTFLRCSWKRQIGRSILSLRILQLSRERMRLAKERVAQTALGGSGLLQCFGAQELWEEPEASPW